MRDASWGRFFFRLSGIESLLMIFAVNFPIGRHPEAIDILLRNTNLPERTFTGPLLASLHKHGNMDAELVVCGWKIETSRVLA
jgi:hypothetical protein